ncbi:MAG: GNAT family N-acetyltransferase [Lachnospiraceae bacterium]|nr:GNAT family N-acetyltransferase [Lachnospiraceae bacterium]
MNKQEKRSREQDLSGHKIQDGACLRIRKPAVLTEKEKEEIRELEDEIYREEDLKNRAWLSNEINFDCSLPCFYLGYKGEQLVSFLCLFMPSCEEAEVVVYTQIKQRRKGYFKALLDAAAEVVSKAGVPEFLFNLEPQSRDGAACRDVWKADGLEYSHTEYRMEYRSACQVENQPESQAESQAESQMESRPECQVGSLPENQVEKQAEIQTADAEKRSRASLRYGAFRVEHLTGKEDEAVEEYVRIAGENPEEERERLLKTLESETREPYLFYDGERAVGVFDLLDEEELMLCGVAVDEVLRNQGYGRRMVQAAKQMAMEQGRTLYLEVDSENPAALHLYQSEGFRPVFEVEYYRMPVRWREPDEKGKMRK